MSHHIPLDYIYCRSEGGLGHPGTEQSHSDGDRGIAVLRIPVPAPDYNECGRSYGSQSPPEGLANHVHNIGVGVVMVYEAHTGWRVATAADGHPSSVFVALDDCADGEFSARLIEHAQMVFNRTLSEKSMAAGEQHEQPQQDDEAGPEPDALDDVPF